MESEKESIEALQHQGWTKQFTACEPRLSEAVELYKQSGFEVHLEPLPPVGETPDNAQAITDGQCQKCYEGVEDQYSIIFTRKMEEDADSEDELF